MSFPAGSIERGPGDALAELLRYRRLFERSLDAIVVIDGDGIITGFNSAAEEIFAYSESEALGQELAELVIPARLRQVHRRGLAKLASTGWSRLLGERVVVQAMRSDESEFTAELTVVEIDRGPARYAAYVRDVTERIDRERALLDLARDNAQIVESAGDGIYRLDLDGRINYANPAAGEILGCTPEYLLGQEAHKLLHHSYEDGTAYPIESCPISKARREGRVTHVTTEVFWRANGTAFPVDYTSAPIREDGRITGAVCVFADISEQREREQQLRDKARWTKKIYQAVQSNRLELHAQPIVDSYTGVTVMHELLVRMRDDDGALLSPGAFLPQAERFGLIGEIDKWVVSEGIRIALEENVSINLSALSLANEGFVDLIFDEFDRIGAEPSNVLFELTETAAIEHIDLASRFIDRLASFGCCLALDDFGTGYGTFAHLRDLPVSYLKIDVDFVRQLTDNPADRRVVESAITVAKNFGMRTIAEGVEDEATANLLRTLGADCLQGYFFGRPEPIERNEETA